MKKSKKLTERARFYVTPISEGNTPEMIRLNNQLEEYEDFARPGVTLNDLPHKQLNGYLRSLSTLIR